MWTMKNCHNGQNVMGPLLFVIGFALCVYGESDFHTHLSTDDLRRYFGVQANTDVPSYEIVTPVHVHGSRRRRSLFVGKKPLRYDVKAFGEDYQLLLKHNDKLIAPGCLVHFMKSKGIKKVHPCPTHEDDCYYHGTSLTHNGSEASLSTCKGLHGLIRLPDRDHDLWIKPVEKHHVNRVRRSTGQWFGQPHIVYKRAVSNRGCAAQGLPEVRHLLSEAEAASRVRRSTGEKYAEMLLVADPTMHQHYKHQLKEYLLTVANVAARILLDPSIGTPVHFAVVKIQILESDQPGLVIVENVEQTLSNFCTWQEQYNPTDDSNPQHYDGATLLTKVDLDYNGYSITTGFATVSGMCGAKTRCSINEDNGLNVGITLAHETGHTLGMTHDGDGNVCENKKNMMSSEGGGGHTAMFWSSCSRQAYADYLATTKAKCLDDQPQTSLTLPKELPGVLYDGNDQCEMYMGAGAALCFNTSAIQTEDWVDECTHLACANPLDSSHCKVDSVPRMDGTMCGHRKYCMKGTCVDIGPNGPPARDGGWSDWDREWSECSRTCGGGVRIKRRKCNNPKPALGGRECPGSKTTAELCNMQECESSQLDFRSSQCALTDSIPYNNETHHWVPADMLGDHQCELYCRPDGQRLSTLRHIDKRTWHYDGTICTSANGSYGRCVDGKCKDFGCDGKSESTYSYDKCAVCGGQGDKCIRKSGTYNQGRKNEYVTFVTLPEGSTAVEIINTNRFTQMSVMVAGKRVFSENGNTTDQSGTYTAKSMMIDYKNPSTSRETISIFGPLKEPVEAQVWRRFSDDQYADVAPQISYEYFEPQGENFQSEYTWKTVNDACTKTCGGGVYTLVITCNKVDNGAQVDEHFCDLRQKPSMTGSPCNTHTCPPRWRAHEFEACSATCGGGQQKRTVDCVQAHQEVDEVVADSNCPPAERPSESQACNVDVICPPVWLPGSWSACSLTCGKGIRTRSVTCVKGDDSKQQVAEAECPTMTKPMEVSECVLDICSPEITGEACKDTDATCMTLQMDMCQTFPAFAQKSCARYCAFCSPQGSLDCRDKSDQCATYGLTICDGDFATWARDNCTKMCGYCGAGSNSVVQEVCEDKIDACTAYPQSVCTGEYAAWAQANCAKFCGFCSAGDGGVTTAGVVTEEVCEDKIDACTAYPQSVCTGEYAAWAQANCAKFCGFCSAGDGGVTTAGVVTEVCVDKITHCTGYGQSYCTGDYAAWAKDHCANFCGFCSSGDSGHVGTTTTTTAQPSSTTTTTTTTAQPTTPTTTTSTAQHTTPTTTTTTAQPTTPTTTTTIAATTTKTTPTSRSAAAETFSCQDNIDNCAEYGPSACKQSIYLAWAKANCAHYCNVCEGTTTITAVTSEPRSSTAPSSDCVDVLNNCASYAGDFCTNSAYTTWVLQNCARHCNVCLSQQPVQTTTTDSPASTTTATVTSTTALSTTMAASSSTCIDTLGNCARYGDSFCSDPNYLAFAQANCARHCEFCDSSSSSTTQASSSCVDKLDNCVLYNRDVCQNATYVGWAHDNCAKFCGFCSNDAEATTALTTTQRSVATTVQQDPSCQDVLANCADFGVSACTNYVGWASVNCKRFCNLCGGSDTTVGSAVTESGTGSSAHSDSGDCVDAFANCAGYGASVCTTYAQWAADNCRKMCNLCGSRRKRSVLVPPLPRSLCNNILTDAQGSLALIGQPVLSPCTQIVVAPAGSTIHLSFTALQIDCKKGDWLAVQEEGGKDKGKKAGRNLCSQLAPVEWTTTGNIATITLLVASAGHGYNLTYKMIKLPELFPSCNRLLTNPTGTVASPEFSAQVRKSQLCVTTIIAPPNFTVQLKFDLINLQIGDCSEDSITVYDEMYDRHDKFCGFWSNSTWKSFGNKVKVIFTTNQEKKGTGFLASYSFIAS